MIFISHRGNLEGPNPSDENTLDYIMNALNENFEVDELSSSYLPLTLKELKIHKKRIRIKMGLEKEKPSINFKEEFVILSVFVTIVLIFIFDPFT